MYLHVLVCMTVGVVGVSRNRSLNPTKVELNKIASTKECKKKKEKME